MTTPYRFTKRMLVMALFGLGALGSHVPLVAAEPGALTVIPHKDPELVIMNWRGTVAAPMAQ